KHELIWLAVLGKPNLNDVFCGGHLAGTFLQAKRRNYNPAGSAGVHDTIRERREVLLFLRRGRMAAAFNYHKTAIHFPDALRVDLPCRSRPQPFNFLLALNTLQAKLFRESIEQESGNVLVTLPGRHYVVLLGCSTPVCQKATGR